jgi:hypothetical protein
MSSELERFRDHARTMAAPNAHRDDCHTEQRIRGTVRTRTIHPNPGCTGCIPAADRALFAQLAAEVDAHLDQPVALCDADADGPACTDAPDCDADAHILACPGAGR